MQPDKLRRIETWLWREGAEQGQRVAVLLDFVPIAAGAATSGYRVGDSLKAELVFYPSAVPLRAVIATSTPGAESLTEPLDIPDQPLTSALDEYDAVYCELPWAQVWPIAFRGGQVRRSGASLFVRDSASAKDGPVLPIRPSQSELAMPLTRLSRLDGIGLWDGYYLTLCWADTELGRWVHA